MPLLNVSLVLQDDLTRLKQAKKKCRKHMIAKRKDSVKRTIDLLLTMDLQTMHFDNESMKKLCFAIAVTHSKLPDNIKAFLQKLQHLIQIGSARNIIEFIAMKCDVDDILFYLQYFTADSDIVSRAYNNVIRRRCCGSDKLDLDQIRHIVGILWENSYVPPDNIFMQILTMTYDESERLALYDMFIRMETAGVCFIRKRNAWIIDNIFLTITIYENEPHLEMVKKLCESQILPSYIFIDGLFFFICACRKIEGKRANSMIKAFRLIRSYHPIVTDFIKRCQVIVNCLIDFYAQTGYVSEYTFPIEYLLLGVDDGFSVRVDTVSHLKMYGIQSDPVVQSFTISRFGLSNRMMMSYADICERILA